jgi:hypothetical protein
MKDWIIAVSSIITATGILFIFRQTQAAERQMKLLEKQINNDHERSRRELASRLVMDWIEHLTLEMVAAKQFAETLEKDDSKHLYEKQPFSVPSKRKRMIEAALGKSLDADQSTTPDSSDILLKSEQVFAIGWRVTQYLNYMEAILVPWWKGVADQNIIEAQFKSYVNIRKSEYVLEKYRAYCQGESSYPAIDAFVKKIKAAQDQPSPDANILGTIS